MSLFIILTIYRAIRTNPEIQIVYVNIPEYRRRVRKVLLLPAPAAIIVSLYSVLLTINKVYAKTSGQSIDRSR